MVLTSCHSGVEDVLIKGGSTSGGPNLVTKCRSADVYSSQQAMQNNCNSSVQKKAIISRINTNKSLAILDKSNTYRFSDVIILMTEINHAHLRIILSKEWLLNIYTLY